MGSFSVPIRGMHCASCEILIGEELKKIPEVSNVSVSHTKAKAEITYSGTRPSDEAIQKAVQAAGYSVGAADKLPWISRNSADYKDLVRAFGIILAVYLIGNWLNIFSLNVNTPSTGVFTALLVGLVAGVSTCMALVGGLVLSFSARHAELHPEATSLQKFRPHVYFNAGRILGYAFFGGLVGLIGNVFRPSSNVLGILTMIIGGVMIFFGLKLIEIFPILKDKSITLPSGVARLLGVGKEVKEYSNKSAMTAGALTFFIPCGFTQAMQLYAVSTGSFWQGMAIMGLFAIGTAPGLLGIGGLTSVVKGRRARVFFMTAGLAVLFLGWTNIANGSRLIGGSSSSNTSAVVPSGDVQVVNMTQSWSGYSPNTFTVEKGRPVKWVIKATAPFSCSGSIVMPKYGINQSLKSGENIIMFTPTALGTIPFTCSMGMYNGRFTVIEKSSASVSTAAPQAKAATCGLNGGCGMMRASQQTNNGEVAAAPTAAIGGTQVIRATYDNEKDIVPSVFTVKKNRPVSFVVDVKETAYGCMSTIMIESLYENPQMLRAGKTITMNFTPTKTGEYQIICAMGVPRGSIKVVD